MIYRKCDEVPVPERIEPMTAMNQVATFNSLAAKIMLKVNKPTNRFHNPKIICHSCGGDGWMPVYKGGVKTVVRCPGWVFDSSKPQGQRGLCEGNQEWKEWDECNRKDLCDQVWKLFCKLDCEDASFSAWLQRMFNVEWPAELTIPQLEVVLVKMNRRLNEKIIAAANAEVRSEHEEGSEESAAA